MKSRILICWYWIAMRQILVLLCFPMRLLLIGWFYRGNHRLNPFVQEEDFKSQSTSLWENLRCRFFSLILRFSSNLRYFEMREIFLRRRTFGFLAALWIRSISRCNASSRFLPWVRNRFAVIISSPSSVIRFPANLINRSFTSSGNEGECRTSNRSCTAVATLFTFCPPGPEDRMNSSRISDSFILIFSLIWIMVVDVNSVDCSIASANNNWSEVAFLVQSFIYWKLIKPCNQKINHLQLNVKRFVAQLSMGQELILQISHQVRSALPKIRSYL